MSGTVSPDLAGHAVLHKHTAVYQTGHFLGQTTTINICHRVAALALTVPF